MQVGVLTYQTLHRKTYDTLCLLKARGYDEVVVYAVPLHYKKKFQPLLEHRPPLKPNMPSTEEVCRNFSYNYKNIENNYRGIDMPYKSIVLVCGCGILPHEIIDNYYVLNAHPGYLPNCRGLDAFKWAIYENQPIGVTAHRIGNEVDAGEVLERRVISILRTDNFDTLAMKVYENEIDMLVNSIELVCQPHQFISSGGYPLHKRMPNKLEETLGERLELKKNPARS